MMITIKKLKTLKTRTRLRKLSIIFHNPNKLDDNYLTECIALIKPSLCEANIEDYNSGFFDKISKNKNFEELSAFILKAIDEEPSDWDYTDCYKELDKSERKLLPITLILDKIRSPFNVGSIFRIADSFGVNKILLIEGCASPLHPRAIKTARGTTDTVDWQEISEEECLLILSQEKNNIIALELGGEKLRKFNFPSSGYAIIGSEEYGISKKLLNMATKRISIEMAGTKGSLNVSTATGIFLYNWFSNIT